MDTSGTIQKDIASENIKDTQIVLLDSDEHNNIYKAVLLKTERLTSAIHLVTGLMDTKENIRRGLRFAAVASINDFYLLEKVVPTGVKNFVSDKVFKRISYIISLLEIGLTGGLISEMNHAILKEEYSKLRDVLFKFQVVSGIGSFVLSRQLLGADLSAIEKTFSRGIAVRDIKDNSIKDTKVASLKSVPKLRPNDRVSRQDLIIKNIKDGAEHTIKDIITQVSLVATGIDCSEKTIQRDLLSLVASGVLIKRGERRWSRYSKALAP